MGLAWSLSLPSKEYARGIEDLWRCEADETSPWFSTAVTPTVSGGDSDQEIDGT